MRPSVHNRSGLGRLVSATRNSLRGLKAIFRSEEAFRMEAIATLVLIPFAFWLDVSKVERVLLVASLLILLIVEMLNTAIEVVVDRIGTEIDPLSGMAKDVASTSVMFALILTGTVWGIIVLF
ncbi:MAG: diacylglycerol kinase [Gammaproteobacteria bacterium]